ncbi:hypothetical protein BD414DRAFT_115287 [Trametes punicea]|nr:hypothetical protein BD414DRAFT_115287 [Trametes punicea]
MRDGEEGRAMRGRDEYLGRRGGHAWRHSQPASASSSNTADGLAWATLPSHAPISFLFRMPPSIAFASTYVHPRPMSHSRCGPAMLSLLAVLRLRAQAATSRSSHRPRPRRTLTFVLSLLNPVCRTRLPSLRHSMPFPSPPTGHANSRSTFRMDRMVVPTQRSPFLRFFLRPSSQRPSAGAIAQTGNCTIALHHMDPRPPPSLLLHS